MRTTTVNTVLDNFNDLLLEEKEFAINLIKKTFAEAERDAIFRRTNNALRNYKSGNVKRGNLNDLYKDLEK